MMVVLPLAAQDYHPQRTAADIARKQTEMLVRELDITDSVLRDTLFRMHLKYALKRQDESYTRADILKCMQLIQEELKSILEDMEFDAGDVDAVIICTYNKTHAECAIYSLSSKPLQLDFPSSTP